MNQVSKKLLVLLFSLASATTILTSCGSSNDGNALPSSQVPATPTGLAASGGDKLISLSWTPIAGALSYKVYYKAGTTASTSDTQVSAAAITGTSAKISGLTNGTTYAFIVVASGASGDSPASVVIAATPNPSTPQLIAIGSIDGATDLSGLTFALESGNPASILGGMGSGFAWAGGNTFIGIPDRGPNATPYDATVDDTTAYIPRFLTFQMTLTANAGAGLPYTLTPTMVNTTLLNTADTLNYGAGASAALTAVKALGISNGVNYFTGRSDGFGSGTSANANDSRFDPEGIRVSNDGASIFIADEYGPYIYQFDRATGKRIKSFSLPAGYYIASKNPVGKTEISSNTSGRVTNKGMEGLAITPDGSMLVGLVQSALAQDGGDGASVNRIITINIAAGSTKEYAYNNLIGGKSYNSSEILAINNHEFLIDTRDGKGLGDGSSAVIKQIYKIDITGATDISNIFGNANLTAASVVPAAKTLFLDVKAALNAAGISDASIPSKIEGLAWGNDIVVGGVTKHTLWITNDNDFVQATAGPNKFYVFAVTDGDLGTSVFTPQAIASASPTTVPVKGISFNTSTLSLTISGGAGSLTPVVTPANATNKALNWSSSNPAVATVSYGKVTPVAAGATVITATTVDGGLTAIANVTVSP